VCTRLQRTYLGCCCRAKDLINKLLLVDPKQRLSATTALQHVWLRGNISSLPLAATQVNMRKHLRKKFRVIV
jgi:serine/threonine protein kinase